MTPEVKNKLSKVYELIKRGSDGEKEAAKQAMDRIVKKYNLEDIDLEDLTRSEYAFKYSSDMDIRLMNVIVYYFVEDYEKVLSEAVRTYGHIKELRIKLEYMDYVTVHCAYEYFRRHMNAEWRRVCLPMIKRKRSPKKRREYRQKIQRLFIVKYLIESKLVRDEDFEEVNPEDLSYSEWSDRMSLSDVKGGQYHRQVNTGHLLDN